MNIDKEILEIIDAGNSKDNIYFLPNIQLDRKVYLKVNKVLQALGGKWNRKAKGHIFDKPIEDAIENVILTGEVVDKKKELQFFETPEKIADKLCILANAIDLKDKVIWEPEAGRGAILKSIKKFNPDANIYWFEFDAENSDYIKTLSIGEQIGNDFLKYKIEDESKLPDFVIMNPPFSKQQDIDHITHALNHLKEGGVLISIMSPSVKFRSNKKTIKFIELINQYEHEFHDLPNGSFKESGTMVNTIILKIVK